MEKLRADAIAYRKKEQQEKHILHWARNRYVELSYNHTYQQHGSHRSQRERLKLQLSYEKADSKSQEHGKRRIIAQCIYYPIHFRQTDIYFQINSLIETQQCGVGFVPSPYR